MLDNVDNSVRNQHLVSEVVPRVCDEAEQPAYFELKGKPPSLLSCDVLYDEETS